MKVKDKKSLQGGPAQTLLLSVGVELLWTHGVYNILAVFAVTSAKSWDIAKQGFQASVWVKYKLNKAGVLNPQPVD